MKTFCIVALSLGVFFVVSVLGFAACVTTVGYVTGADSREKAERTDTRDLNLTAGNRLKVVTAYGDIHVRTTDTGGGSMHARVQARGKTTEEARSRLERTRIAVDEGNGDVALSLEIDRSTGDSGSDPKPRVDFELVVPAGVKLELSSSSGDVLAEGGPFGACTLKSSYGDVQVDNVRGDASLDSSSGSVTLTHQSGGRATLKTSYGSVNVSDIDATFLRAETSSGSVKAANLRAPVVELESDYGDVRVDGAVGQLAAHTSSGSIEVVRATPQVAAKSDYGSVMVDGVLEVCGAHSSSGSVKVVAREGSVPSAPWRISSSYGSVSLEAPREAKFDLEAKTAYGHVDLDFAIELPPGSTTKRGSAVRGKVNGGGPLVTIESSSGSVMVRPLTR